MVYIRNNFRLNNYYRPPFYPCLTETDDARKRLAGKRGQWMNRDGSRRMRGNSLTTPSEAQSLWKKHRHHWKSYLWLE